MLQITDRFLGRGTAGAARHRDDLSVYRRHAMRAMREERWSAATIFFDRMLEVDPRNTEALLMKGLIAEHCCSDPGQALECYRKVIHLCGWDSTHRHAERARHGIKRVLQAS